MTSQNQMYKDTQMKKYAETIWFYIYISFLLNKTLF